MAHAAFVAAGILLSRLAGLIRLRAFAHYFGVQSDAADAFNAAFRIPNLLQNLLGEGALSASFIPAYAALVERDRREADRLAGAIGALLALLVALLVGGGIAAAPILTAAIAPGFAGDKRALTVLLVRILFPGAGLLVLSAWCLGVLNSHRRFLLSYAAPVVWNAAMIATLLAFGPSTPLPRLAVYLAWGSVAGSVLQFAVQLPAVLRVATGLRVTLDTASSHVRGVVGRAGPALLSRGVVQISAFVDTLIASLLPTGAVTGLANAQLLYTLPISLFGMSVAAAELPAMASEAGGETTALRARLDRALRHVALFVIPSAVAFLAFGDVVAAALLQTGRFGRADAVYVWGILAGSSIGLLASTLGRVYSSAYYALRDTRTPLAFAVVRIVLATVLGYALATQVPARLGIDRLWGAAGLTVSASAAGWVEYWLLRRSLNRRIGPTGLACGYEMKIWAGAAAGAAAGWSARLAAPALHPIAQAAVVLIPYGVVFAAVVHVTGVGELSEWLRRRRR